MGFTWTPGHKSDKIPISLAIRTCAGCYTGRVRLDDGTIGSLSFAEHGDLAPPIRHGRGDLYRQVHGRWQDPGLRGAILRILDDKHSADPRFFFKNAEGYGPEEEARQVETFKAALGLPLEKQGILALMRLAAGAKLQGVANLKGVADSKPNSPAIGGGPPGLIDSSGLGIAAFVAPAKLDPKQVLFDGATKNDVPGLWNQWTRKQWQWDGNIRDVLARNLVAALGLVGLPDKMDITANVVVSEFIDNLPPAPYPFAMPDMATVGRGRSVYEANCIACHREDQRRGEAGELPVFDLGTDMNRAKVVRPVGYQIIEKEIVACYQPADLRFRLGDKEFRPNQNVDGADLLIKRFTPETQGYVAPPLDGLWARAPYLHNGSVPTLRHLLVPSLREQARTFVRGAISYDTKNLGWSWEVDWLRDPPREPVGPGLRCVPGRPVQHRARPEIMDRHRGQGRPERAGVSARLGRRRGSRRRGPDRVPQDTLTRKTEGQAMGFGDETIPPGEEAAIDRVLRASEQLLDRTTDPVRRDQHRSSTAASGRSSRPGRPARNPSRRPVPRAADLFGVDPLLQRRPDGRPQAGRARHGRQAHRRRG